MHILCIFCSCFLPFGSFTERRVLSPRSLQIRTSHSSWLFNHHSHQPRPSRPGFVLIILWFDTVFLSLFFVSCTKNSTKTLPYTLLYGTVSLVLCVPFARPVLVSHTKTRLDSFHNVSFIMLHFDSLLQCFSCLNRIVENLFWFLHFNSVEKQTICINFVCLMGLVLSSSGWRNSVAHRCISRPPWLCQLSGRGQSRVGCTDLIVGWGKHSTPSGHRKTLHQRGHDSFTRRSRLRSSQWPGIHTYPLGGPRRPTGPSTVSVRLRLRGWCRLHFWRLPNPFSSKGK